MEMLQLVIHNIWEGLSNTYVPILDITFKTFLVGQLLLFVLVGLLNFFLGKDAPASKT